MKRLFPIGVIAGLLVALTAISFAAVNLNSSKSNVYRLTYDTSAVTRAQATLILKDLDTIGRVDEAKVRQLLRARGINAPNLIIRIVPAEQRREKIPAILVLTKSADEAAAIAVGDDGGPQGPKDTKSGVLSPR